LLLIGVLMLPIPGLFRASGQPVQPITSLGPDALLGELGCANCHHDLKTKSTLKERTPNLSFAGLRYNPAYLFDYLQNPVKVRRHLGHSRMPDFRLDQAEALALVSFLELQRKIPGPSPRFPVELQNDGPSPAMTKVQFQTEMTNGLICLTCHTFEGKGGIQGVELSDIGYRLQKSWVKEYLSAPSIFGVAPLVMPHQFYNVRPDRQTFEEMIPQAAGKIRNLADFFFSLNREKQTELERKLNAARQEFPSANAALGEKIFRALNCAACHQHNTIEPDPNFAAPELSQEPVRVKSEWLENYLRHPVAIRPFGYRPGDGSRMPDFRLSDDEAATVARFLFPNKGPATLSESGALSTFSAVKIAKLMTEKFSCTGCHQLNGKGGKIGPDLTGVGARLQPEYIYQVIKNPRQINPKTIMPKAPLSDEMIRSIATFLAMQRGESTERKYLSLAEYALIPFPVDDAKRDADAWRSYTTYCAACHGVEGQGDGFNARYLEIKPTIHADHQYLSTRPDDTLYDGISSGGYILNRSHQMPAWGESLSSKEIRGLVSHIRTLCRCQGPSWSLDNGGPR